MGNPDNTGNTQSESGFSTIVIIVHGSIVPMSVSED